MCTIFCNSDWKRKRAVNKNVLLRSGFWRPAEAERPAAAVVFVAVPLLGKRGAWRFCFHYFAPGSCPNY